MDIGLIIFFLIVLYVLVLVFLFLLRKRASYKRSEDLVFLNVIMPRQDSDLDEKQNTLKDFRDAISRMDQLLASLKSVYSKRLINKIIGQDVFSFEYVLKDWDINFYVVIPRKFVKLFEKQINWFFSDAIIEETEEVNIFKGKKYSESAYLYLAKDYYYPIKTYQKLEVDPINNITNAFSKLWENETCALQIMLRPVDDDWQHECAKVSSNIMKGKKSWFSLNPLKFIVWFLNALLSNDGDSTPTNDDSETSALSQERAKTVDEKWDKTWFEVVIRVIVTWDSRSSVNSEMLNIISTFSQFNYPDFNGIKYTLRHSRDSLIKEFLFRTMKKPLMLSFKKMILNTEEISSIFHFPHSKYNKTPDIRWQRFKIVQAPKSVPKEGLLLWHNEYRWVSKEIRVLPDDRFRHFYVIGQTGTWKSSILQVMARQDLANWKWIAVIDPHGDLANDLLPFIPRERADDVIYFDPSDVERPMGLNMIEANSEEEKDLVAMDAMNIMIKLFWSEIFGPRIQDYFSNAVLTLMDFPEGWAVTDVVRLFTDDAFQRERVRYCKNPIVKAWWESTYAQMWDREKKEIIPYFAAKFWQFITNSTIRNIIWQTKSSFDVFDLMQDWKILMVNLSKWELWDLNSELLGLILVSKIQIAAMRRQKIPKDQRTDFFMYIDEFQNYVTPAIESILSEARKYRLGMVLAHQYLWQLEKSDALTKSNLNLKEAIFGNVGSVMTYKIWPSDAEFLARYFAPDFSEQDLVNVDKFKAVMKLAINNQPSSPFSMTPLNPYLEEWNIKLAKAYKELSRLKYWRDRAFVDREIKYRIWNLTTNK